MQLNDEWLDSTVGINRRGIRLRAVYLQSPNGGQFADCHRPLKNSRNLHQSCGPIMQCSLPQIHKTWAPSQYPKRRLFVRSRKVSKLRDLYLELPNHSEIWQALRQHCCRCACQISKWCDNLKYQSRGFETSRDLTKRRLFGYWDGALYAWEGIVIYPWNSPAVTRIRMCSSLSGHRTFYSKLDVHWTMGWGWLVGTKQLGLCASALYYNCPYIACSLV